MIKKYTFILLTVACFSCSEHNPTESVPTEQDLELTINPAKWYNDHSGAVSITYDGAWAAYGLQEITERTMSDVLSRGLRIDYECVTDQYENIWYFSDDIEDIRDRVIPSGVHFFGHGHKHINHDALTYEEAAESFGRCFDLMHEWGFNPKVYGYPGSAGREEETQRANREAGFIAARGVTYTHDEVLICPDEEMEPENWYYLPSAPVAMVPPHIYNNPEDLLVLFEEAENRTAWAIIMYHAIGIEGGYAYYPYDFFVQDLDNIQSLDLWCGNFDNVALYIYERNAFTYEISNFEATKESASFTLAVSDGFENDFYDQPLTLIMGISEEFPISSVTIEGNQKTIPVIDGNIVKFNLIPDETEYQVVIGF